MTYLNKFNPFIKQFNVNILCYILLQQKDCSRPKDQSRPTQPQTNLECNSQEDLPVGNFDHHMLQLHKQSGCREEPDLATSQYIVSTCINSINMYQLCLICNTLEYPLMLSEHSKRLTRVPFRSELSGSDYRSTISGHSLPF